MPAVMALGDSHYVALLTLTLRLLGVAACLGENPSVSSTSGHIIGHRAPNRTDTYEFLGIKYGQAPVGGLRFAAPQSYSPPDGTTYNASQWNPYEIHHPERQIDLPNVFTVTAQRTFRPSQPFRILRTTALLFTISSRLTMTICRMRTAWH